MLKKFLLNKAHEKRLNLFNDPDEDAQKIIEMVKKKSPMQLQSYKSVSCIIQLLEFNIEGANKLRTPFPTPNPNS